jgi:hypothetical protein
LGQNRLCFVTLCSNSVPNSSRPAAAQSDTFESLDITDIPHRRIFASRPARAGLRAQSPSRRAVGEHDLFGQSGGAVGQSQSVVMETSEELDLFVG